MRALMFKEFSQVSGGNYTPNALELSGGCSMLFGLSGGLTALILGLIPPKSGVYLEPTATGVDIMIISKLSMLVSIPMGIGLGSTLGAISGFSLYSLGFEVTDNIN